MFLVHVTNRQQLAGFVEFAYVAHPHATRADDRAGQRFARRRHPRAPQHMPRHNREGRKRGNRGLEERPACKTMAFVHNELEIEGVRKKAYRPPYSHTSMSLIKP